MLKLSGLVWGATAILFAATPGQAQEARQIARACAGDIERLCAGVPPGQGRIKACMKAHVQQLSAPCFDAIMAAVAAEKEPE
ncbi:MAG: cysteine rich repeat-containing protein [Geminicoccaceae bacterium]